MALILTGTPALLVYLAGERYGRLAFRRYGFVGRARRTAPGPEQVTSPAVAESVEPDVRWQTSYAPAWRRMVAFVIDAAFALMAFFVSLVIAFMVDEPPNAPPEYVPSDSAFFIGGGIGVAVWWLFQARWLSSARQATLGMRLGGVFVTDTRGNRLSFARAMLRHLYKLLSYPYGIGVLMQPFTTRRQTLHDRLSGSVVLTRPKRKKSAVTPGASLEVAVSPPPVPVAGATRP